MSAFKLLPLPPEANLKSRAIGERLVEAQRTLAELKACAKTVPNQEILTNAVVLLEAKASSEIEGIRATLDEICLAGIFDGDFIPFSARDVRDYTDAMARGFELVREQGRLSVNTICEIQQVLEHYTAGLRMESGTVIQNPSSGQIVYVPPQDLGEIMDLLRNLEQVFNDDDFWPETDPLIKMAAAHYQFESIHPFHDGNGRTGRILNVLYLVLKGGLDAPVLSLSRFILQRRKDYYRLFREVRQNGDWEGFVCSCSTRWRRLPERRCGRFRKSPARWTRPARRSRACGSAARPFWTRCFCSPTRGPSSSPSGSASIEPLPRPA